MEWTPSVRDVGISLDAVLRTEELNRRPSRPPDYQAESRALAELSAALADSPRTILQKLVEATLTICRADSAGLSLLSKEDGGKTFVWPAIAGALSSYVGDGTPRDFGPCGVVLDSNAVQLFAHPERYYSYMTALTPAIEEVLLAPFYMKGKAIGTVWVIAHDPNRKFDSEDMRLTVSLGKFAANAYQALESMDALERQGEALGQADRRKNEFLAMLAHELRNPLAPIRNAVQTLRSTTGEEAAVQSTIRILDRQVGQMCRLIDDLLDVGRISQGKIELHKVQVELISVIHDAVEAARPHCQSKGHGLTVTLPTRPIYLHADPTRLAQVVGNLLTNACKFTERGGLIRLNVAQMGAQAFIEVKDDGIGIAEHQLLHIFEMFTQVDTSLERSQSGLGIGLSLVKILVELHGGVVEARSAGLSRGSEFVVRLPVYAEPPPLPQQPCAAEGTTMSRRVLLVDDNIDSANSLSQLLRMLGHEVHTAHDGLEAVQAAARVQPEVILLDLGLPKLNGYEAARRIRDQHKAGDLLLVAVTGWSQEEDRHRSRKAGFNAHLVKPLNLAALTKLLAELKPG